MLETFQIEIIDGNIDRMDIPNTIQSRYKFIRSGIWSFFNNISYINKECFVFIKCSSNYRNSGTIKLDKNKKHLPKKQIKLFVEVSYGKEIIMQSIYFDKISECLSFIRSLCINEKYDCNIMINKNSKSTKFKSIKELNNNDKFYIILR